MRICMLTVLTCALLLTAGCGKKEIALPGESPVYTINCDDALDNCYTGAKTLCNGDYEPVDEPLPGRKAGPGSFGWVDVSGEQQEIGGGGGRYSIRIRCR